MSRSTTSLASSHTEVDRLERSFKHESRLADIERRIADIEKRTGRKDRPWSSRLSPISSSSADRDPKQNNTSPPGPPGPGGPNHLYQPQSPKFWLILVSNFLAMFLVALDRTIVATAIPRITDDFHSLGDIGWYGSAYMLTTAASQLVFGRLYKYYNMKW